MADGTVNIIRKIEVVEGGGHHGGAWKVAYADFMTAMMAFFLLMWILSSSDEQKLRGIAEYFTNATLPGGSGVLDGATLGPPGTMTASNGSTVARGAEFGEIDDPSPAKWEVMDTTPTADPEMKTRGTSQGHHENPASGAASETFQSDSTEDAVTNAHLAGQADAPAETTDPKHLAEAVDVAKMDSAAAADASEQVEQFEKMAAGDIDNPNPDHTADIERFEDLQSKILQAMEAAPDLAPLQENIIFERTPEGMLIQIVDSQGKPMFASGSATMNETTMKLMALLGESLTALPNDMVISGHTDAVPFTNRKSYDNWDLSTDRANAMRRILKDNGVTPDRITRVSGMAATQLLKPEAPTDASNRRIEVMLAYEKLQAPTPAPVQTPAPAQTQQAAAPEAPAPAVTPVQVAEPVEMAKPEMVAEAPRLAESLVIEEKPSLLDEQVFENLRSALR
ncbi:flagellar motor protein MotB [Cognatishimia maritima]|uniref:Chemotaxis protein MotB n=1 Tax=Cognatishimia maritima TaxID=870908 RepID=A0A1M5VTS9_9RHOB|nr:flagellar motor protein MotB [Cognatishimia maritima]SHH78672.1 chemotaxis protein MotB [Cognatishimia maritima]